MAKILLISPNMEKNPLIFPLGLGYIRSALVNAGFDARIVDFGHVKFQKETMERFLVEFRPDFIGVSIRNLDNCCMQHPRSFVCQVQTVIRWIREWNSGVPVILGGSGFSLLPLQWLNVTGSDYGIIGDGVRSFPLLIEKLLGEKPLENIPGLVYYKGGKLFRQEPDKESSLDSAPYPSRDGFLHELSSDIKVRHNVQTKRGCGLKCLYCAYPYLEGTCVRLRSPPRVADEIYQMKEVYGIREFDFVDSVFNVPMEHGEEICREIISRKLDMSWGCFLHPSYISEDFLKLLKRAGCTSIEFGIDSGSEKCLRAMGKSFGKTEIRRAAHLCKLAKIDFNFCLLFGGPEETMETLKDTLQLMEECEVDNLFGLFGVRILPNKALFNSKFGGMSLDELLEPKFYFSEQLNIEEALDEIMTYKKRHPGWVIV